MFARNGFDVCAARVESPAPAFTIVRLRAEVVLQRLDRNRTGHRLAIYERGKYEGQVRVAISRRIREKTNFHGYLIRKIRQKTLATHIGAASAQRRLWYSPRRTGVQSRLTSRLSGPRGARGNAIEGQRCFRCCQTTGRYTRVPRARRIRVRGPRLRTDVRRPVQGASRYDARRPARVAQG